MEGTEASKNKLGYLTNTSGSRCPGMGWVASVVLLMALVDIVSCASSISRVLIGENVIFLCNTPDRGFVTPHYIVWHKGQKAVPRRSDHFYFDENTGSLTINKVTIGDEGNYTCSAGWGRKVEPYTVTLFVSIAPRMKVMSPNPVRRRVLEKLTVSCKTTGRPRPSILWYSSKGLQIDKTSTEPGSRFSIHEEELDEKTLQSSLIISPVLVEDRGSIVCLATNVVGSSKDNIVVDVQQKPVLLPPVENVLTYWWEGRNVNMTCASVGSPAPFIVWTSFDEGGKKHRATLSPTVSVTNGISVTSTLRLPSIETIPLPAIYKCQAENIYGSTMEREFHVKEGFIPSAPMVNVVSIKDDEIALYIRIPGVRDQPPVSYVTAYYRLVEGVRDMELSTSYTGNGTRMFLRGIMLGYRYVIRVKAFNIVGESGETAFEIFSEERTFTIPPPVTTTEEQSSITNETGEPRGDNTLEEGKGRTLQSTAGGGANSDRLCLITWSLSIIFSLFTLR